MGMKTGAMIAHFADALPMNKLIIADSTINASMSGICPNPDDFKIFAPSIAMINPRFVHLK